MSTQPEKAKYKTQKELLLFMSKYGIKCKLAADLLNTYENKIHFYRIGKIYIDESTVNDLKERYLQYTEHQKKDLEKDLEIDNGS